MNEDLNPIEVEYAYLTIPARYVCVYHKLVSLIAEAGEQIINDCTYACKDKGKTINNCWSLFQSAIANYNIGEIKKAEFFIDYVNKQLELLYNGKEHYYPSTIPVSITPDGKLKAIISCCSDQRFYVDTETGNLYRKHKGTPECLSVDYTIINNNLAFNKHE